MRCAADGCSRLGAGGFAIASTDMGHQGMSAEFGRDPQKHADFAYRGVHLTALAFRPLPDLRIGGRGAVPDGDDVAGTDEDVGFTALDPAALQFGRAQHDEQRVVVNLQLGPLMGAMGVLDRQIVQTEPRLDVAQHFLARLQ